MPSFRYLAITPTGVIARGIMNAVSEAEMVAHLRWHGSIPMRVEPDTGGAFRSALLGMSFGRGRTLTRQEAASFTRGLATMLSAGQDLDRALRFLVETARGARVRNVLQTVRDAVRDGSALSASLAQHPNSFSRVYIAMVRAGEAGGTLAMTLNHLASLLERELGLAASIRTAMIYPVFLILVAGGAIAFLLTWVMPQFVPLFDQAGVTLPRSTRILIAAGELASSYGLDGLLALTLLCLTLRQMLRRPRARQVADRLLLRTPLLGRLAREVMAARFARTLGTLLLNGVQLMTGLGIAKDVIGNLAGVAAIEQATTAAKRGAGLSRSLGATGVFPPQLVQLLRLGEETAQLGGTALRAAEIHEEKVRIGLQRLVALITPAITVLMGAAVAAIVASLLLAILSLNELAQ